MEKNKYYFVFYECKIYGWKPIDMGGASTGSHTLTTQAIIDIHPIQFQLDCNEKHGKINETHSGYRGKEEYKVVSWNELSKEEYEKYKDQVG